MMMTPCAPPVAAVLQSPASHDGPAVLETPHRSIKLCSDCRFCEVIPRALQVG